MVRALSKAGMFALHLAALLSLWVSDGDLGETHRAYPYKIVSKVCFWGTFEYPHSYIHPQHLMA